jgi:hypothetical protein
MGWDTQIVIIVENITGNVQEVASALYNADAKEYYSDGARFVKYRHSNDGTPVLCFTYERRKYLPYWAIQEVSQKYPEMYFTAVGSCPDFLAGPAGLVKIINGEIVDSYGFFHRARAILSAPRAEPLYRWFGKDGLEETFRALYPDNPRDMNVTDDYVSNLIEFSDDQNQKLDDLLIATENDEVHWKELSVNS